MDDAKAFIKQYWPYLLGGVVGLWIVVKFMGRSSGSSSSGADYSAYSAMLAAQANAASQNAAYGVQLQGLQIQAATENAKIQLQRDALSAETALANRQLDFQIEKLGVEQEVAMAQQYTDFHAAQGAIAESVGSSTAMVIQALNQPALAAMQNAAKENESALNAAAMVALGEFGAISDITQGANGVIIEAMSQFPSSMIDSLGGFIGKARSDSPLMG